MRACNIDNTLTNEKLIQSVLLLQMSDGESSHHSNSSLEVSISVPFEVKDEAVISPPGSEVEYCILSYWINTKIMNFIRKT